MLTKKVIFVTGASGGIGSAVARHCASQGAYVFLGYYQNHTSAQEVFEEIKKNDGNSELLSIDLKNVESINQATQQILERTNQIDGLVHCAGIHIGGPLISMKPEEIQKQLDVGLTGSIYLTKAVIASMVHRRQGSIIHMGSVSAHRMVRGHSVYSAAKAGLEGFTKALAAEVAKRSIRVNCVVPGPVRTPMLEKSMKETGDDPTTRVPLGRMIEPKEVAEFCGFLLSDKATAITGGCFPIDGGYLLW